MLVKKELYVFKIKLGRSILAFKITDFASSDHMKRTILSTLPRL